MKRIVVMALLALALPIAAAANSVDFTNTGGSLTGSSAGLSLSGSTVALVNGFNGGGLITGSDLGSVAFSTGSLTSGSLQMGGVFAGGGSFTITGNGMDGLPNGVIFTGSFNGPVTWTMLGPNPDGTHNYMLSGTISGTWYNGTTVGGAVVQLTVPTGKGFYNGLAISSGDISISTVPEPGTLGLLGTGLVGIAGVVRRKLKS
jgi:PEP-CTERM motif